MRLRRGVVLLFAGCLSMTSVYADVTIRGRTVTTEQPAQLMDPAMGQAAASALGAFAGLLKGAGPQQPTTTTEDFVMYIKDGRMRMDSGQHTMILDPRAGSGPVMLLLDHASRQAMNVPMSTAATAEGLTSTTSPGGTVTAAGGSREIIGYATRSYDFSVTVESGLFAAGPAGATPRAVSEGTAWIAADVPGLDEIRAFYRAFAAGVQQTGPGLGAAGLTASMAALTEHGLPLETTQKTTASIESATGTVPVQSSTSTSTVTAISTDSVTVDFYENGLPPGYQLVSIAPGTAAGAAAGRGAGGQVPCDCSCKAFEEYQALEAAAKRGDAKARAELEKRTACVFQCLKAWTSCRR